MSKHVSLIPLSRLVPYKGEKMGYVYLDTSAGGCSSPLGKKSRYNHIEFGSGCSWGNLCHEFMHTLGKPTLGLDYFIYLSVVFFHD